MRDTASNHQGSEVYLDLSRLHDVSGQPTGAVSSVEEQCSTSVEESLDTLHTGHVHENVVEVPAEGQRCTKENVGDGSSRRVGRPYTSEKAAHSASSMWETVSPGCT